MEEAVTLVTGAGRGAGRGVAHGLAAARGGTVFVADINGDAAAEAATELEELGVRGVAVVCDLSVEEDVAALFDEIRRHGASLDVLVNTVAWIDPSGPVAEMSTDTWHRALRVNLDSIFYTCRAALGMMIPRGRGVIINFASLNGTRGFPDRGSYGASKAAVINLTQTIAMENRRHGIRANAIVPGGIDGERVRELRARRAGAPRTERPPELGSGPELIDPEWIGRYLAFLVSDEGRHINGQSLVIGEATRTPLQALFPDI